MLRLLQEKNIINMFSEEIEYVVACVCVKKDEERSVSAHDAWRLFLRMLFKVLLTNLQQGLALQHQVPPNLSLRTFYRPVM